MRAQGDQRSFFTLFKPFFQKHRNNEELHRKPKTGRKPKTTERQQRRLVRLVKDNPNKTASDVRKHAEEHLGVQITNRTARNILKRHKLNACRPARKPLLKQCHRMARLQFARAHQHWNANEWRRVLWSDEAKFNLYNADGGNTVRRPPGKRYDEKYIRGTMKFGGGQGVMVWGKSWAMGVSEGCVVTGCFSGDTLGPLVRIRGTLNGNGYRSILEDEMLPFARDHLAPDWIFQQDSAPCHVGQLMLGPLRRLPDGRRLRLPGWFRLNNVPLLRTPARSPDISPIENLWQIVKRKLAGRHFQNQNQLWEAILESWNSIPLDTIINLINSLPRRIEAVIRSRGGPTKY